MERSSKRIFLTLATFLGLCILYPTPVWANSGVGAEWMLLLMTAPQGVSAFYTRGIGLLVIMLIEAIVLKKMLQMTWPWAFSVSFVMNLISAAIGFGIGWVIVIGTFYPIIGLISIIVLIVVIAIKRKEMPLWTTVTAYATIFGYAIPAAILNAIVPSSLPIRVYDSLLMYGLLLPSFGLSIFIEGLVIKWMSYRDDIWKAILVANIITYILLVPMTGYFTGPRDFNPRGPALESRVKGTLRSIGSSQLAYQSTNHLKVYGSFDALKKDLYVATGYTRGNMIENYSMSWNVSNISTVQTEEFPTGIISRFEIIAYPLDTRPGMLYTFAITEDNVVRVYIPENGNVWESIETWDPIL